MYFEVRTIRFRSFSKVARKSFNDKCIAQIDFPIGYFMLPNADANIGSLKSLHTLGYMLVKFEQIRIVQTIQNFQLCDKNVSLFLTKQ